MRFVAYGIVAITALWDVFLELFAWTASKSLPTFKGIHINFASYLLLPLAGILFAIGVAFWLTRAPKAASIAAVLLLVATVLVTFVRYGPLLGTWFLTAIGGG